MADYAPGQPMEEILASIKRIIAEEAPAGACRDVAATAPEEVLELGEPAAAVPSVEPEAGLVSAATENASRQALAALSALTVDPQAGVNTLDGLVRELIRPMLRDWLDANLPTIVERMVAREVARLVGR